MLGALAFLLIGSLLQGALCGGWTAIMPPKVVAVKGSCVTVPCSFDIEKSHEKNLNNQCEAKWRQSNSNPTITITPAMTGDLTKKDCTSTFNNMTAEYNKYIFRLECPKDLKWNYIDTLVQMIVTEDPPTLNLTPSTLEVKEGSSVSLTCSAPAPCLTHPPTLTWTPSLGDVQEQLQENEDKTKVKRSVLNFTASHLLHQGRKISCTAVYKKQDGSKDASVSRSLTAAVSFPPQILPSSHCTKTAGQVRCSCETVGNPSPTLHWYLDDLPINQSDKSAISIERLNNDKGPRSFIIVNQPQEMDRSILLCRSVNSLGSASQQFCFENGASAKSQDRVLFLVFTTTNVILFTLVCYLLCVIRALKNRQHPNSQLPGEIRQSTSSQHLIGEANEVPNSTEEETDVNRKPDAAKPPTMSEASSEPNNAEELSKSTEKNEEESDVIYTSVYWKSKNKKGEDSADMNPSGGSNLEEEKRMMGGLALEMGNLDDEVEPRIVRKEAECEYAQVKFKTKNATKQ